MCTCWIRGQGRRTVRCGPVFGNTKYFNCGDHRALNGMERLKSGGMPRTV